MRLVLIRHAEAFAGLTGTIAGPSGCRGLTPRGCLQAEQLRDHLLATDRIDPDVLLASELPRAVQTASIIAPALGFERPEQDCDLCEVHTGEADATDWADHLARFGSFHMPDEPDRPFAPGGDSWNTFNSRVEGALERLAAEHPDRTVVAVCHAGVIAASLRVVFGIPDLTPGARMQPTNTGLTEWEHDAAGSTWTLRSYNDTTHLQRWAPRRAGTRRR